MTSPSAFNFVVWSRLSNLLAATASSGSPPVYTGTMASVEGDDVPGDLSATESKLRNFSDLNASFLHFFFGFLPIISKQSKKVLKSEGECTNAITEKQIPIVLADPEFCGGMAIRTGTVTWTNVALCQFHN